MKWLSDQLVFKSNNNFPINPYVDYPEKKNEKKKEIKETNISESNMGMDNSNQSGINNNISSSTNVNAVEEINKEDNKNPNN
jgi:hypothetical protein